MLTDSQKEYCLKRVIKEPNVSGSQISREMNIPSQYVNRYLKEQGYARAAYSPFRTSQPVNISDKMNSFIIGSLLGDGTITKHGPQKGGYRNSQLHIKHSVKQKDYLLYKKFLIQGEGIKTYFHCKKHQDHRFVNKYYESVILTVQGNPSFNIYRDEWYTPTKTILSGITISPLALAIWYMDDGSCSNGSENTYFFTNAFTSENISVLQNILLSVYSIETTLHSGNTLYVPRGISRLNLWKTIEQYVPKCMYYKCPV